ncbi:winged helix-turn-helix domain-containing protein [Roseibium sp. MMSF_3412]|uniref:winged helix-turn-helix domain-containing protein n=1 Tax=Roseibium sp. MMSF_3412 TaxID=3046712 RepID=UPI00273E5CAB|nr:winged helix-turn-helix domain-containing protein [Roseibium sp. MMSF_3412]
MKIIIDGWRIDSDTRQATREDVVAALSPRALRLLLVLAEAEGRVLQRGDLLDLVWPTVTVSDESLSQVISELRRKLRNRGLIETIARTGYRLTAPVMRPVESGVPAVSAGQGPERDRDFNLEAHALCLEARSEMVRCGEGSLERAEHLTAEAVEIAPDCASVRAERAIALARAHTYWPEGRHILHAACSEAELAVSLDRSSPLAQSALGYVHALFGSWTAAERGHAFALSRNARDPLILHNAAWYLMSRGKWRAALSYFEQVGDLEPHNIKGYLIAAQLSSSSDPSRSRRNAERALKRARARIEEDPTDPRALTAAAVLMALLGERQAAFASMEDINVRGSSQAIYHASAMALIGETDRAILLLEELFDHGWRDVFWLDADPGLATLTHDRRFRRMRQSLAAA